MKTFLTPLFGLLLSVNISFGQNQQIAKIDGSKISIIEIDKTVKQLMDTANVQGLSLSILNNNKPIYTKAYGFKNKTNKEFLDTETVIYGASFSKAVFAFLTLKLVEKKVINLDKPLSSYLAKPISDYEYFKDLANDDRWKKITARMCLSHTSGLPNVRWFHPTTGVIDTTGTMKMYFNPGERYAYSGEGMKLLQLTIEEITGKTIEELAVETVFKPIGMNRSSYIWQSRFEDNFAIGHLENDVLNPRKKRTVPVAPASLMTTITDYSKFISYVMQQKGLSKELYKEMWSPQIEIHSKYQFPPLTLETTDENKNIHLSYGLGWGYLKCKYGRAVFKEGHDDAWRNYNINFIDKGISIIIMTNSANGEKIFKELLATLIADTFTPWKWETYYPYDYKK